MYSFKDDYSEGAHPRIMKALLRNNHGQEEGYGLDHYCMLAIDRLRGIIGQPNADIHFVSGGTQANLLVISAILQPFESVIAASSAHINIHETGAIEAAGHKINLVETSDGKLKPEDVKAILGYHVDEHMVVPGAVYISQSTEYGTIYSKEELRALSRFCKSNGLRLYLDGARLAMALTAQNSDLTLPELAAMVDVFYIGGTKNGGLSGEAIVFTSDWLSPHFRYHMKQKGALQAKSRLFGIQFLEMFENDLFFQLGKAANDRAALLARGIRHAGFKFWIPVATNQVFPILPNPLIGKLKEKYDFYVWTSLDNDYSVIRLVTSWATPEEVVEELIKDIF